MTPGGRTFRPFRLLAALAGLSLLVGAAAGWATGALMKSARLPGMTWSDQAALGLAMALLAGGVFMAALSLDRRGRAFLANPRAPDFMRPIGAPQTLFFRLQAGVLVLAGLLLATPVIVEAAAHGQVIRNGSAAAAGVAAGFALQSALNVVLWRRVRRSLPPDHHRDGRGVLLAPSGKPVPLGGRGKAQGRAGDFVLGRGHRDDDGLFRGFADRGVPPRTRVGLTAQRPAAFRTWAPLGEAPAAPPLRTRPTA